MPNIIKLTPSLCGCSPIQIGFRVENDARTIEFDFTEWSEEYGSGAVELLVKRKGDEAAYPVALEIDGTVATWNISDTDTSVPGYGKAEYSYTVGTTLAKTAVFTFFVAEDLADTTQDPPDPYQTWVDTLTSLGAETLGNAIRAEDAADRAEDAQSAAEQTVTEAAQYAQAAEESAVNSAQSAGASRDAAESALSSADTATASAQAASGHATAAETAKDLAISAAESAQHSETQAELSASAAAESAESASGSATNAQQSASNAYDYAAQAMEAASDAQAAERTATASATTASNAAQSATQSANNASQSASNASQSATQASQSATNAASSATSASGSATAAATSATNAATSATGAAASATAAAQSATEAAASAASASYISALPTDTASGAIASFSDGADNVPVEALTVSLEPIQDLNGQSAPYPAGGGKNKFPFPTIQNPTTLAGVTLTVNSDMSMHISGTATAQANFTLVPTDGWSLGAGTWTISGTGLDSNTRLVYGGSSSAVPYGELTGTPRTFTSTDGTGGYLVLRIASGTTVNQDVKIQIESGTTATAYAPYENICPITGHTQCEVWRAGINIFDKTAVVQDAYIDDASGVEKVGAGSVCSDYITVVPNSTYYIKSDQTMGAWGAWYDADKNYISGITGYTASALDSAKTKTAPSNAKYMRLTIVRSGTGNVDTFCVNYPSSDHDYHDSHVVNIEIPLSDTVYGGTVDVVQGVLTVDRAMVDLGSLNWAYWTSSGTPFFYTSGITDTAGDNATTICSTYVVSGDNTLPKRVSWNSKQLRVYDGDYTDVATFATAMNGVQLCYSLATPITIQLTDIPTISTLLGTNNIWSDSGNVSVTYRADIQKYIAKVIAEALA